MGGLGGCILDELRRVGCTDLMGMWYADTHTIEASEATQNITDQSGAYNNNCVISIRLRAPLSGNSSQYQH